MVAYIISLLVLVTVGFLLVPAYGEEFDIIPIGDSVQLGCHKTPEGCFNDPTIKVKTGDKVIFHNPHDEFHYFNSGNLETGPQQIFNTGLIYPGDTFTWTPKNSGIVQFFCLIHPWMSGTITVTPADNGSQDNSEEKADDEQIKDETDDSEIKEVLKCKTDQIEINGQCVDSLISKNLKILNDKEKEILKQEALIKEKTLENKELKDKQDHKIIICHIPPGNPDNAHSINIDKSALDTHLRHNDTIDECPDSSTQKLKEKDIDLISDNLKKSDEFDKLKKILDSDYSDETAENMIEKLEEIIVINDERIELLELLNEIENQKTLLCHFDESSGKFQTILIGNDWEQYHLSHGDEIGSCSAEKLANSDVEKTKIIQILTEIQYVPYGISQLDKITPPEILEKYEISNDDAQKIKLDKTPKNQKITICHIPPGNPDNSFNITIDESALEAHLNHGDSETLCESQKSNYEFTVQWEKENFPIQVHVPQNQNVPDLPDDFFTILKKIYPKIPSEDTRLDALISKSDNTRLENSGVDSKEIFLNKKLISDKVTICHIPPGNPENPQTLEISPSALQTHLNHGDSQSKCNSNDNLDNPNVLEIRWYKEPVPTVIVIPEIHEELHLDDPKYFDEIPICHSSPEKNESIFVSYDEIISHLDHNDKLGYCIQMKSTPTPEDPTQPTPPSPEDEPTPPSPEDPTQPTPPSPEDPTQPTPTSPEDPTQPTPTSPEDPTQPTPTSPEDEPTPPTPTIIIQKEFITEYITITEKEILENPRPIENISFGPEISIINIEYVDSEDAPQNFTIEERDSIQFEFNDQIYNSEQILDESDEILNFIFDEQIEITFEETLLSDMVSEEKLESYSIPLDFSEQLFVEKKASFNEPLSVNINSNQSTLSETDSSDSNSWLWFVLIGVAAAAIIIIILLIVGKGSKKEKFVILGATSVTGKNFYDHLIFGYYDNHRKMLQSAGNISLEGVDFSQELHDRLKELKLIDLPLNVQISQRHLTQKIPASSHVWFAPKIYFKSDISQLVVENIESYLPRPSFDIILSHSKEFSKSFEFSNFDDITDFESLRKYLTDVQDDTVNEALSRPLS
jgi:plastocyanin